MIPEFASSGQWVMRRFGGVAQSVPLLMTGAGRRIAGAVRRPSLLMTALVFAAIMFVPMLLLAVTAVALHADPVVGLSLAFPAAAATTKPERKPANIRQMEADLKLLAKELEIGQTEMAAGPIPQARGDELEEKAKEMETLQAHIDQYNRIAGVVKSSREVASPTMPSGPDGQRRRIKTTAGHLFVMSEAFRQYKQQGKMGWSNGVEIATRRLNRLVTLSGAKAIEFEAKAYDPATLSDLGTDAIVEVDRDRELVRFEEPEILTIRDVLNSAPTTGDSIKYVKHTATTRAAASQDGRGGLKDYLKVTFVPTTVPVETIAVLSKVTEQDVDDAPRLVGYINGEMSLDVKVEEERQLLWGSGDDGEIEGLFTSGEIEEFDRSAGGDTVIDTIRRMRTDLRKRKVTPNFATIDPLDWEEIELSKGTDDRYIWGLVTDLRGPRIWSLRVVESDAMTNATTGQRRVLVGDGIRGATIYDRHDIRLAIGYVDDDFARNLRTLRAEERIALALKRSWAFSFAVTHDVES